jgi:hypothetical protein
MHITLQVTGTVGSANGFLNLPVEKSCKNLIGGTDYPEQGFLWLTQSL